MAAFELAQQLRVHAASEQPATDGGEALGVPRDDGDERRAERDPSAQAQDDGGVLGAGEDAEGEHRADPGR